MAKPKTDRELRFLAELRASTLNDKLDAMLKNLLAKDEDIRMRDGVIVRLRDEVALLEHELKRARESARLLTSLVEKNRSR